VLPASLFVQGTAEPLERRALWVTVALLAVIVVDVAAVWADALEIRLIDRVLDGERVAISTLAPTTSGRA
jgi:hypothetical protein